ncbi:MAG: hypothetical protein H6713_27125 [Myxococcales bacterium]|nr:hypothetical protein [Myxococcales bacterium]
MNSSLALPLVAVVACGPAGAPDDAKPEESRAASRGDVEVQTAKKTGAAAVAAAAPRGRAYVCSRPPWSPTASWARRGHGL